MAGKILKEINKEQEMARGRGGTMELRDPTRAMRGDLAAACRWPRRSPAL